MHPQSNFFVIYMQKSFLDRLFLVANKVGSIFGIYSVIIVGRSSRKNQWRFLVATERKNISHLLQSISLPRYQAKTEIRAILLVKPPYDAYFG